MRATREGTREGIQEGTGPARSGRPNGRRGAVWGASAAVVVAGAAGLLGACGGGSPGPDRVAVGAVGEHAQRADPTPTGGVRLVPLDSPADAKSGAGGEAPDSRAEAEPTRTSAPSSGSSGTPQGAAPDTSPPSGPRQQGTGTAHTSPAPAPSAPSTASPGPAVLTTSEPVRTATDRRWCEDVRLSFQNSGGTPVRSGTVTFGTHVVDALGTDWSTVESAEPLPAPLGPGAREERTWTVCVDSWRVPLGMRIETRDVTVRWE
ncbi:hypothetical protein [Streptomyces sp. NPDC002588]|uniref:hypothetical protein n=1 Tax=Streptomyces sp. NPDC002588 TaxID=3154419 RepID=UPI0033301945